MDISIKQGFLGQRMVVLPKKIISGIKKNPLIATLYFTDIGNFPNASHHEVRRKNGSRQYILIYCYKGEGTITIDNRDIVVKTNAYYIIPPGVSHSYCATESKPWSIYWLHFTGPQAPYIYEKFASQHPDGIPLLSLEERRIQLFESMITVMESGYSDTNLEYTCLSLWQLLNAFLYDRFFIDSGNNYSENNTVDAAIEYMRKNIGSSLKIDQMASLFSYSPSHFFTLFKKRTGYSPIHYFNYLKIQRACQYLSFTTMSIKEISFMLGFNDPLYFSRLFKKIMGTPPLRYRKEYSK